MGERRSHDEPYKRFACDRCHALKLRCMRKDEPDAEGESCVRCHRAGALCRYSPSERLGRPPDKLRLKNPPNPRIPSQKRRRCGADAAMEWVATAPSSLNRSIPDTSLWDEQSPHEARWTAKDDLDDSIELRPKPQLSQQIGGLPLIDTGPHPSDLGSTGESNQDMFSFDNGRDLFESPTRGSSADFDLDDSSLEFLAVDCFADTGDNGTKPPDYSLGMSTMFQETAIALGKRSGHVAQDSTSSKQLETVLMTNSNEGHVETTQSFRSTSSDVKEQFTRQLSDIIIKLFQQLKAMSSGSSVKVSSPSPEAAPQDRPAAGQQPGSNTISIGNVFRISEELIGILESFEPISRRNASPSTAAASGSPCVGVLPPPPSNARPMSPISLSSHDCGSVRARNESNSRSPCFSPPQATFSNVSTSSASPAQSLGYSNERARSESSVRSNNCFSTERHATANMKALAVPSSHFKFSKLLQLDIPIMLLIVTCYNLLTRIYNVFFTCWLRILTKYPSAADRELLPEILPCFELGGFKPPNYGSLQMSIIIEASMHLIRKIEEYLERPDRKQEGGKGPEEGPNLQLMDLVMEDCESPFQLRENVEAIKRLIKG